MADFNPRLPTFVMLPRGAIVSSRQLRDALGIKTRSTLNSWVAKAAFPAPYHPNGNLHDPHYFTADVVKWLQARSVVSVQL